MERADYQQFPSYWDDARIRSWNLWSYVDESHAGQSVLGALGADLQGAHAFIIAAADTVMRTPSRALLEEVFPGVALTREIGEHQAFGAGGRHFCLGTALARLELRILFEETLKRYPKMELAGKPAFVESLFINQLKTLPVRLSPA